MNYQILINKNNSLPKDYIPSHLVKVDKKFTNNKIIYLENKTYNSLSILVFWVVKNFKVINKKFQTNIIITTGYKTYFYECLEYRYLYRKYHNFLDNLIEYPGYSEYQTGLAFDLEFENECIYQYFLNNMTKYGVILRYPQGKELITGFKYQKWHFRYVGKIARYIEENNLVLDEL